MRPSMKHDRWWRRQFWRAAKWRDRATVERVAGHRQHTLFAIARQASQHEGVDATRDKRAWDTLLKWRGVPLARIRVSVGWSIRAQGT